MLCIFVETYADTSSLMKLRHLSIRVYSDPNKLNMSVISEQLCVTSLSSHSRYHPDDEVLCNQLWLKAETRYVADVT